MVQIGTVVDIVNDVEAFIRIDSLHGTSNDIPNEDLPIAVPAMPTISRDNDSEDGLGNVNIKIGDRLYVNKLNNDMYIYYGKEYKRDSSREGKSAKISMYSKDKNVGNFGGFTFKADSGGNVFEIISAEKSGNGLGSYCGMRFNTDNGNIEIISKDSGNGKAVIELDGKNRKINLKVSSSSGHILSEIELGYLLKIISDHNLLLRADAIIENEYSTTGTDYTEWKGNIE